MRSCSAKNYAGSGLPQGPFWENNLFPLKEGLQWVFVNGLKWVQKWVFGCKNGSKVGRNPLFNHFKPISGILWKPTFYPVKGGGNCFLKRGPETVPTQHKPKMPRKRQKLPHHMTSWGVARSCRGFFTCCDGCWCCPYCSLLQNHSWDVESVSRKKGWSNNIYIYTMFPGAFLCPSMIVSMSAYQAELSTQGSVCIDSRPSNAKSFNFCLLAEVFFDASVCSCQPIFPGLMKRCLLL